MKTLLRIARFELSTLFFSPIAWVLMVIFVAQTAMTYTDLYARIERFIKLNFSFFDNGMTYEVFAHPLFGLLKGVLDNMYLYIPLLTMGLISKELSSGSIKLLMSSPVNARQIVLGKFLAIVGYCTLMVGALFIFMIAGGLSIESVDYGLILSGIFAFILLTSNYAAIGLFVSSLTSYQIVAGIGTLGILAGLNYVGELGQTIPVVSELTYWLSISGRSLQMVMGLISTADVIYFLVITIMFLAFTEIKISSGREVISIWKKMGRYAALFGCAAIVAYVSSRPALTGYVDMTATKWRTLTTPSESIVEKIDGPVKMITYVNILDNSTFSALPNNQKRDMDRFDNYQRYLPQLESEYVYFYDTLMGQSFMIQENQGKPLAEVAKQTADAFNIDLNIVLKPDQIKQQIDLSEEDNQMVREISYNGKKTFLRMFDDQRQYPSEQETSSALKRLITNTPKAVFTMGHGERDFDGAGDKDYRTAMTHRTYREAMIQKGFDFERVDLAKEKIPADATFLVIADPRTSYSKEELVKIAAFIGIGGNMIIMGEPANIEAINPIYNLVGVQVLEGSLLQKNKGFEPDFILADFTQNALKLSDNVGEYIDKKKKITMPGGLALHYAENIDFNSEAFLEVRDDDSYLANGGDTTQISAPVALSLTKSYRDREQRILVFGDADFMNNVESTRQLDNRNRNPQLVGQCFSWMTYGEFPVNADRQKVPDKNIKIGDAGKMMAKITLVGIIPFIIAAFGSVVLVRRRRK